MRGECGVNKWKVEGEEMVDCVSNRKGGNDKGKSNNGVFKK